MSEGQHHILIAEDDPNLALIARRTLETAGHRVTTVESADDVLPKILLDRPDVLLLDIMMPSEQGLDGFALCQKIKESPAHSDLPVVIVSAIADGTGKSEEQMRRTAGADAYIHKPYSIDRLRQTVEEFLS